MVTPQPISNRFIWRNGWILLFAVMILLAACSPTPQPIKPTMSEVTPAPTRVSTTAPNIAARTPDPGCMAWQCTLSGTVYSGTTSSGHELPTALVHFSQYSNCSPTSGVYTLTTDAAGQFSVEVYVHDTDGFRFFAAYAGEKSAAARYGGMDCLSCSCQPVKLLVAPLTTLPELAEAAIARQLLKEKGDLVWGDWSEKLPPLLLRDGEYDYLLAHPAPPTEFILQPADSVRGLTVYRRAGHLVPVPAATAWEVGDVWSVAAPTREGFQQAIDAQLGKGAVQLDAVSYIRAIVHEAFHVYAMTAVHGQIPNFGADVDEGKMLQRLSTLPDPDQAYIAEGQALVKAIQTTDPAIRHEGATEFLKLRQARRAAQDQKIAAYEQTTEWVEGLARYSEVNLMRWAGDETDRLSTASIHYPGMAEVWQTFLDHLAHPTSSPDGFRGRYYLLGAGQAFLLDRLMPDWTAHVLADKLALEDLLAQALR